MEEKYFELLDELVIKYSLPTYGEYKDGGSYGKLFYYSFKKGLLSIILHPDGKPNEHIELIQSIISDLIKVLPKDYKYKLCICGWYSDIQNGDLNINFSDGNNYIKNEHQEMYDRKEIVTITDIANLNNVEYSEFKWNILKKKSTELGFVPVKEKSNIENLYLLEAFKICYPEYNYEFNLKDEVLNAEPKKKKFLGLF